MDLREQPLYLVRRHPWEVARAKFFARLLAEHGALVGPRSVLDVGAGDGYVARQLLQRLHAGSRVVCFDENYAERHLAELSSESPALIGTRVRPRDRFDLLLLLDVIEHVPDDLAFLGGLVTDNVHAGGSVLISVPAWPALFTRHDVVLRHYRRYRPPELLRVVEAAGLEIVARGGLFHSLLLPRALQKLNEVARRVAYPAPGSPVDGEATTETGRWNAGELATRAVSAALAADNQCSRAAARLGIGLPGVSAWVLARKPESA
jgi:2-polyprenyl-3-methyl-5-hydroxy-6-metoxy-1,4-benzoquinol methylase